MLENMQCRCLALGLFCVPSLALSQGDPAVIDRIIDQGKSANQARQHLRELTSQIGARRTGSQSLAAAQQWAMKKLREYGWKNVRLEKWGEVPIGFERGPNYHGGLRAPFNFDMEFSAAAWTPGTKGALRAEAVLQPETLEELTKLADSLAGKWIVMRQPVGMRSSRRPDPPSEELRQRDPKTAAWIDVDLAMDKLPIAGRVYGGSDKRNLVHTHGTWTQLDLKNLPTQPRVNIGWSNMRLLRKQFDANKKVELEFNVDQRFVPGAVPQYNVVAEFPGTDKADEYVMFGGHLDSWDGPKSQGANDNGTGTTIGLEAARLIAASGAKPRRTLIFTLWSGEEQGLLGSIVQAREYKAKGMKISALFNEDAGSNFHSGLWVLPQWKEALTRATADTNRAFPENPVVINEVAGGEWPRGGGSDHAAYLGQRIPAFFWGKKGPQRYGRVWHTQYDRYEETIPEAMVQMSTNMALTVFNVACADEMLWRPDDAPTSWVEFPVVKGHFGHEGCNHGGWAELEPYLPRLTRALRH